MSSIHSLKIENRPNDIDFPSIFETLPGLYLILSPSKDFRIMAVNDAFLKATMTKREDILGEEIFVVFPDNPDGINPTGARNFKESLQIVLETKKPHKMDVQKYDIRRPKVLGGDFEERYWNILNVPVFNEMKKMIAIIHRIEDVTEFIRTKQLNESMQNEMIRIKLTEESRLSAIKESEMRHCIRAEEAINYNHKLEGFIDMVCHEIRNPLNGVIANAELLNSYLSEMQLSIDDLNEVLKKMHMTKIAGEMKDSLSAIQICSESEKIIVDDLLDLSKLDTKKLKLNLVNFNLKELISTCLFMQEAAMKMKSISKNFNFPSETIFVSADPFRLGQIFTNLISNAVKFTAQGGCIEVSVSCNKSEGSSMITVSVKDNGIGMTEDEQQHLFDKFYQANHRIASEYGGSGLGLLIAKQLVELMGGDIKVTSQKNVGTTVAFSIVCSNPTLETTSLNASSIFGVNSDRSDAQLPKKLSILIVEDNKVNQNVLRKILEKKGYICFVANNGQEALDLYEKNIFDLIFMDFEMPVMGGLEATFKIRLQEKKNNLKINIPIVGLSANPKSASVSEGLKNGMTDFICKPYQIKDIYQSIKKWALVEKIDSSAQNELTNESGSLD